jgi:hypothetical protein
VFGAKSSPPLFFVWLRFESAGKHALSLARRRLIAVQLSHVSIGDIRRPLATSPNKHVLSRLFFSCCGSFASVQKTVLCADEAGIIYFVLLLIRRMFFSRCESVAWPQEPVWAPAWAPRSRTCDRSYGKRLRSSKIHRW